MNKILPNNEHSIDRAVRVVLGLALSPPATAGTTFSGITGTQGPTR